MSARRAPARAALILAAAAALPGAAAAQYFPAQPGAYLLGSTVRDARALWVNPAILASAPEASIGADLTATFGGGEAKVTQAGITLASRGLAFGWSRTTPRSVGPPAAALPAINTFALGFGLGDAVFSAGATRRWYRSSARKDAAWEIGARYAPRPAIELTVVWRDIGSPAVSPYRPLLAADSVLPARLIPGVGLALLGGRLRLGAEWETTGSFVSRVARVGGSVQLGDQLRVLVRSDLSSRPEERRSAVAVQWSARGVRATLYSARPSAEDRQDLGGAAQFYALPTPVRRRPR